MKAFDYIMEKINEIGVGEDTWNDKGLGRLFAQICKPLVCYVPESKGWYYYQKGVWKQDLENLHTKKIVKIFTDVLQEYCRHNKLSKEIQEKAYGLTAKAKRDTIIKDAECEVEILMEQFDADVNILNCKNCTLDLRTFERKEHNPSDLLSKICNVRYDEKARCERWEQFISEIMEEDESKIDYLQRILGYTLTGNVQEEEFYIFYGSTTRNGKSTLFATINHLLGGNKGYAANVDASTFSGKTERKSAAPSGDIARLAGVRFAVTTELPKNMLLNNEMLKSMTGRDKITARHLQRKEFEYIPQFKLFMNTNSLPFISDSSIFDSNRVKIVAFNRHFKEEEQDKTLKDTLKQPENLSGILNWLLDGLKKAQTNGMNPPQAVIQSTEQYRQNFDKLTNFMSDCLEPSKNNITMNALYRVYQKWANENKIACEGKQAFKQNLIAKNVFSETGTVDGKTERNVIKEFAIKKEYLSERAYKATVLETVTPGMTD